MIAVSARSLVFWSCLLVELEVLVFSSLPTKGKAARRKLREPADSQELPEGTRQPGRRNGFRAGLNPGPLTRTHRGMVPCGPPAQSSAWLESRTPPHLLARMGHEGTPADVVLCSSPALCALHAHQRQRDSKMTRWGGVEILAAVGCRANTIHTIILISKR